MARSNSPAMSFNSYEDDPLYESKTADRMMFNSDYTQDISEQMRVPKRIKATGEYFDDPESVWNGNSNRWDYQEKFDMTVPDRIMVIGQEQHHGTRSAPREIILENSIMKSPDRDTIRVSTPPRSILLAHHHFPTASEHTDTQSTLSNHRDGDENDPEMEDLHLNGGDMTVVARDPDSQLTAQKYLRHNKFQSREGTPPLSQSMLDQLTPSEELYHLRKDMQRLRARLLRAEQEINDRIQRERYLIGLSIGYFLLKAFWWLKNN